MQAQRAEGTKDLIGRDMRAWQKMQDVAAEVFGPFGFEAVETPAIEQLDVFVHGIGQSTDVVRKEMFRVFSRCQLRARAAGGHRRKARRPSSAWLFVPRVRQAWCARWSRTTWCRRAPLP